MPTREEPASEFSLSQKPSAKSASPSPGKGVRCGGSCFYLYVLVFSKLFHVFSMLFLCVSMFCSVAVPVFSVVFCFVLFFLFLFGPGAPDKVPGGPQNN